MVFMLVGMCNLFGANTEQIEPAHIVCSGIENLYMSGQTKIN